MKVLFSTQPDDGGRRLWLAHRFGSGRFATLVALLLAVLAAGVVAFAIVVIATRLIG